MNASAFQKSCRHWHDFVFPEHDVTARPVKRVALHLEESTELAQAVGLTEEKAIEIVRSVYAKPVGEVHQELGGCYTTLALVAEGLGESLAVAGYDELDRAYSCADLIREKSKKKVVIEG